MTDSLNPSLPNSSLPLAPTDDNTNQGNNNNKRPAADETDDTKDRENKRQSLDENMLVKTEPITDESSDLDNVKIENDTTIHIPSNDPVQPIVLSSLLTDQQQQHFLQAYAQASAGGLMMMPTLLPTTAINTGTPTTATTDYTKEGLSNDERRQRRLLRNRVAAKECRKKKKHYIQTLEDRIVQLEADNATIRQQLDQVNSKLALAGLQDSESYRLMKEVEELNAKLGHLSPQPI